jgi:DNA-binding NarL/FixJ family response regulator
VVDIAGIAVYGDTGQVHSVVVAVESDPLAAGRPADREHADPLTEMESRVLEGVAAGLSTDKLAPALNLSRGGVEYHVARLLRKLRAANRTSLVSRAFADGMLDVGSWPPRVARRFVK